jgi:hypothetical protein
VSDVTETFVGSPSTQTPMKSIPNNCHRHSQPDGNNVSSIVSVMPVISWSVTTFAPSAAPHLE